MSVDPRCRSLPAKRARLPSEARLGGLEGDAERDRIEELGDAEVEKHGLAFGGDQDVAGLEIAVDDEALVGVMDRHRDIDESRTGV